MSVQHIAECWGVQLPPTEKLVLIFLSHHANKANIAWPSTTTILKSTGISKATFYRAMAKLKKSGLVIQTYWRGLKAYKLDLTGRPEESHTETGVSHHEKKESHHETHNCSELYLNCSKDTPEPSASGKIISIFKYKDSGMKPKTKMPVGAPLSETLKTSLDKPRRKSGGPDTTSTVYRNYRTLVRNEFNFNLPEPAPKDLGIMKHLIKRWGADTPALLTTIIQNYNDFRVYAEDMEGEPVKGAYPALPLLLKLQHLGPNFVEWLDRPDETDQVKTPGVVSVEVQEPVKQSVKVTVVQ